MWQGALEGETKKGLIQLRIPERLKAAIEDRAERQRVTTSSLLRMLIEEELSNPGDADKRRRMRWDRCPAAELPPPKGPAPASAKAKGRRSRPSR
jgi:hypothetical protein